MLLVLEHDIATMKVKENINAVIFFIGIPQIAQLDIDLVDFFSSVKNNY
jgi:hypothetical protein